MHIDAFCKEISVQVLFIRALIRVKAKKKKRLDFTGNCLIVILCPRSPIQCIKTEAKTHAASTWMSFSLKSYLNDDNYWLHKWPLLITEQSFENLASSQMVSEQTLKGVCTNCVFLIPPKKMVSLHWFLTFLITY